MQALKFQCQLYMFGVDNILQIHQSPSFSKGKQNISWPCTYPSSQDLFGLEVKTSMETSWISTFYQLEKSSFKQLCISSRLNHKLIIIQNYSTIYLCLTTKFSIPLLTSFLSFFFLVDHLHKFKFQLVWTYRPSTGSIIKVSQPILPPSWYSNPETEFPP